MSYLNDLLGGDWSTGSSPHVSKFYDRGGYIRDDLTDIPSNYYTLVTQSGKRETVVLDGSSDIDLGSGAEIRFLSVGAPNDTEELYIRGSYSVTDDISENNKSISALVSVAWAGGVYGNYFDMYLGSDLEGTGEKAVADVIINDLEAEVDLLLVDHHGSDTNFITSTEFVDKMLPEVAVISVWNNTHGHPRATTIENLQDYVEQDDERIIRLSAGDPDDPSWAPETMAYCHTTNRHLYIWTNGAHYIVDTVNRNGGNDITDPDLHYHEVDEGTQFPPTPLPTATPKPTETPTPPPTATPTMTPTPPPTATPAPTATPTPIPLLIEGFDDFHLGTRPSGWTFVGCNSDSDTYTSSAYAGAAIPSIKLDETNDSITTTSFANPDHLTLWMKGISTDSNSSLLIEEYYLSWSTVTDISNLPTSGTTGGPFGIDSKSTKLRFSYTRSLGNLAFDDVIIYGP